MGCFESYDLREDNKREMKWIKTILTIITTIIVQNDNYSITTTLLTASLFDLLTFDDRHAYFANSIVARRTLATTECIG